MNGLSYANISWIGLLLLVLLPMCLLPVGLSAQNRPAKDALQRQIQLTDQLLSETENKQDKTQVELSVLSRQISLRKRLIIRLTEEIDVHTQQIKASQKLICALESDMNQILSDYGKTAQLTYQRFESENFWTQILSSGSLQQAFQRVSYFQQLSRYRHRQVGLIQQTQEYLTEKAEELASDIKQKEALIVEKEGEMLRLDETRQSQEYLYADLKVKGQAYRRQLHLQQAELKGLIRKAEDTFLLTADKVESDYGQTFPRSKGFLPWPVASSRGVIVGKFGETEDPFGNRINNDGIYIRAPKGQMVRSVHSGKVTGVRQIPMSGFVVILEHGDFRTVYANIADVSVNVGEFVSANQRLGIIRTDPRTQETTLNFLIYQVPDEFIDPERWIIEQ